MNKKIAVVILNYNGQPLLEKYLPSVFKYSNLANLYVIDNASSDNSLAFLGENYPKITIIPLDKNYGYATGYNMGLKNLAEEYFCLLNSDIRVSEYWIEPVLELFETDRSIAAIQPKILDDKNPDYFEYAGAAGGFIDAFGIPFCRGRFFETIEKDIGQYDDVKEIFWASGACFFIRKVAFQKVNGFDDTFFAHQEEIDLCWRLKNNNFKIFYQSESTVFHLGGATLKINNPLKTYLNFRNSLYMLYKNLPIQVKFQRLLLRLCIDGLIGLKYLFAGQFKHTWSIIKAHFSFYFHLSALKSNRLVINKYYQTYSIIWSYFVENKKYFKD